MSENNEQKSLEKEYRQAIRKRYILAGSIVFLVLAVLGMVIGALLYSRRAETFVPPKYDNLETESPQYWRERTQFNIDYVRSQQLPEAEQTKYLRTLVLNDIKTLSRSELPYDRIRALLDIALTLAENDVDINIDSVVRGIEDRDNAYEICGRIYISQALMHLRLNNRTAARTAVADYMRLFVTNDLKLDSAINEFSFCGAVTIFSLSDDNNSLNDLFQKHLAYSHRIGDDKRMRAVRIIAGELTRVGRSRQAIETLKYITDAVEFCRACQLIISLSARPPEIKPVGPAVMSAAVLQSGMMPPLKNEQFVINTINEIINFIVNSESVDVQIDILVRLSGSQMMCDPDIHRLFKDALKGNDQIDDIIKKSALRLLNEPQSETIRIALKMPPLPEEKRVKINIDTAQENWNVSWGAYAGANDVLVPELVKQISDIRFFRIFSRTARGYLSASRNSDAVKVIQRAKEIVDGMEDPAERVARLLTIAELQIGAGNINSARSTLLEAGLPPKTSERPALLTAGNEDTVVYSESRLSELARLQIVARFFDDALNTIKYIDSETVRDDNYDFLVQELIQVGLIDEAKKVIEKINDAAIKSEKEHILAVLEKGLGSASEEHLKALRVSWTEQLQNDDDLVRCIKQLIRRGLLPTTISVVYKISDIKVKSENLSRIAVEYLQLWTAYNGDTEQHKTVRANLQKQIFELSESIPDVLIRSQLQQKIVAIMLPEAEKIDGLKGILIKTVNELLAAPSPFMTLNCQQTGTPAEVKSMLITELLLQKIALERVIRGKADELPFVDVDYDKKLYTDVRNSIDIAVELLNEAETTLDRGTALSNLGRILLQIGRNQAAMQMLDEAKDTANELSDKTETVTVMLTIPPIVQLLGQHNTAREVFQRMATTVSESFVMKRGDMESVLYWRQRDVELDRIIRKMIQLDYVSDAIGFSVMIDEPVIRDRLQRTASYIHLDKKYFPEAEAAARRITNEVIRRETIQDVSFLRRSADQEQKQNAKEPKQDMTEETK
ncbi:MAG: hypothetical protein FWE67_05050 [Planctomycetaceae bacterium]|nr:hypothetical protein [Planctomycetaceae bacterium]